MQELTLQILNAIDAILIGLLLAMACYNFYKYIWKGKIRQSYILLFYVMTFFCLISWESTAIFQTIEVDSRYLVYQRLDKPAPCQVT